MAEVGKLGIKDNAPADSRPDRNGGPPTREYPAISNYRALRELERKYGFDPNGLQLPDRFATYGPLHEVFPDLRKRFTVYWYNQIDRVASEPHRGELTFEMTPQEGFDRAAEFFHLKTNTIKTLADAQPGRRIIGLDDADETDGRLPVTGKQILLPGFKSMRGVTLISSQQAELRRLQWLDSYTRFQVNPAAPVANSWIDENYGDQVQLGTLSTKAEDGLIEYLAPELGPVKRNLIMSCVDGTALELIPDVVRMVRGATEQRQTLKFEDVMTEFKKTSPPGQVVLPERVIADLQGDFSEYDLKLLMMIRLLEKSRSEGHEQMATAPHSSDGHQEWFDNVHPETAIVLFDDAKPHSVLPYDSGLLYVQVPRFRLPEDFY